MTLYMFQAVDPLPPLWGWDGGGRWVGGLGLFGVGLGLAWGWFKVGLGWV